MRWWAAVVVAIGGCSSDAPSDVGGREVGIDARETIDSGADDALDSGRDAPPIDAPIDVGRDAPEFDAGTDAGWACSIAPQGGCAAGFTCRLSAEPGVTPWFGAPSCQRAGTRIERQSYTSSCREYDASIDASVDLCGADLYCGHSECYRYCDPDGDPCPPVHGSPMRCVITGGYFATIYERWGLGTCAP